MHETEEEHEDKSNGLVISTAYIKVYMLPKHTLTISRNASCRKHLIGCRTQNAWSRVWMTRRGGE